MRRWSKFSGTSGLREGETRGGETRGQGDKARGDKGNVNPVNPINLFNPFYPINKKAMGDDAMCLSKERCPIFTIVPLRVLLYIYCPETAILSLISKFGRDFF